ncbi:hypothetical protein V6Z11_A03G081400 [Gossypium hirsutum]
MLKIYQRRFKRISLVTCCNDEQCQAGVSAATNVYKYTVFEESYPSMNIKGEQCAVDIPVANNIYACIESKQEGVRANVLINIGDDPCEAVVTSFDDYQLALKDEKSKNLVSLTKEVSSLMLSDERCSDSPFGVHIFHTAYNDDEDYMKEHDSQAAFSDDVVSVKTTLAEELRSLMVSYERFLDSQVAFNDDEDCVKEHDSLAAFSDGEESVKTTDKNSQVDLSNYEVFSNNEFRNDCDKVKQIINHFRHVYNKLLQVKSGKLRSGLAVEAAIILQNQHKWIKRNKQFGSISGVEIGDYFCWRAELNIIGLHCRNVHGIDFMKMDGKNLAISVVDSGRYDNVFESNNEEFPDTLVYLGEGSNPKVQSKKSIEDQKLRGGNLALKNSVEAKNPVRVIRKIFFKRGKVEKRKYIYDGLYFVDSYRQEIASSGKLVFKFLLKKFPSQPKLDWRKLVRELDCMSYNSEGKERSPICAVNALDDEKPLITDDISQGEERIPIRAINALDDEKLPIFNYVTSVTYLESYCPSMINDGCDCIDGCLDFEDCPCIVKNGGSTYDYEERLFEAKPFIVECGPSCKCFTSCLNRVSQCGIQLPLEYTGEILRDKEGEQRIGNDEYLFDIGVSYGDHSLRDANSLGSFEGNECFTIDAARVGNVGRFINHSCSPNLFPQSVLFDHDNKRMPHIMLFAMEDIPPLNELTYDYNYEKGGVCDANGNIKIKHCYCDSSDCTGRMY